MKKNLFAILALLMVASLVLGACATKETAKTFKVGLVTDVGVVDDKNFNQATWEGVLAAQRAQF